MPFENIDIPIRARVDGLNTDIKTAQGLFSSLGTVAVTALASVAASITATMVVATKQFGDFQEAIGAVRAELGGLTDEQLEEFQKGLLDISAASGTSLTTLTKGLAEVADAGIAAGNELEALNEINKLAITTGTALNTSINAVQTAMNAFGESAGSVAQVTDTLFETARVGVVSVEELNGVLRSVGAIAANSGIQFQDLAGTLAFLTSKGVTAQQSTLLLRSTIDLFTSATQEQKEALRGVGLEADKATLANKPLLEIFQTLNKASADQLAVLIPNVKARENLTRFTKDAADATAAFTKIQQSAGSVDEEFIARQEELNFQTRQLAQNFNALLIEGITPFIPAISEAVGAVNEMVTNIRLWVADNENLIDGLVRAFNAIGPFFERVGEGVEFMGQFAANIVRTNPILSALSGAVEHVAGSVKDFIGGQIELVDTVEEQSRLAEKQIQDFRRIQAGIFGLTDAQKEQSRVLIENIRLRVEEREALLESGNASIAQLEAAQKEIDVARDALRIHQDKLKSLRDESPVLEEVRDAQEELNEATSKKEEQDLRQEVQVQKLTERYRELLKALNDGKISNEQFTDGLVPLVDGFREVLGTTDLAIAKLKELTEGDKEIRVEIKLFAEEQIEEVGDRIRKLQEEITLNALEGDAKELKSLEFKQQQQIRDFEARKKQALDEFALKQKLSEAEIASEISKAEEIAKIKGVPFEAERREAERRRQEREKEHKEQLASLISTFDKERNLIDIVQKQERDALIKRLAESDKLNASQEKRIDNYGREVGAIDDVTRAEQNRIASLQDAINAPFSLGRTSSFDTGTGQGSISNFGSVGGLNTAQIAQSLTPAVAAMTQAANQTASVISSLPRVLVSGTTPQFSRTGSVLVSGPSIPGFAHGTPSVPETGLAIVHRGERIIPAGENRPGGEGITVINLIDKNLVPAILAEFPNAVLNIVNADIVKNGTTRRVIRSVR